MSTTELSHAKTRLLSLSRRARPSFKHQADRAARLPKRLQRCHSAPAVLAVQGGEEILVSLTAGPPENRQPLHHAVTAQDGRSIVLSLTGALPG